MNDFNYPINGSCQCGNITYQLLEPPLSFAACHCIACQKLSASAFSITAFVKTETVLFEGEMSEWKRIADNGNKNYAKFCPTCGNRIYHFNPDKPDILKLKPSYLSNTDIIEPSVHIWVSKKQKWFKIPDGVKQYDEQP